ncbi:MAG: respiratory nitrate reductase subunit gamma [Deltaproteobacteria bacterium]|nr:respiratory nitrate reductase subunit gamma [Deltaproteobacteria bacterium]MBW2536935.1 respiratory nitrate reductase subunit gamma [Deltaproteobacteria bacterium]
MSGYAYFVGGVLPYLAVCVFVIGMAYRFHGWYSAKQPGKMKLFTSQNTTTFKGVLAETFLFPSLFKGDRSLWAMSWLFHVTLALVFLGHLRVVAGFIDATLVSMGMSAEAIGQMSSTVGGGAGVVLVLTGALLFIRRLTIPRVREISGVPDFFALLLVLAIIVTGNAMRFGSHIDLAMTREWVASLLVLSPKVPQHDVFLLHALLGFLLFMYIPFSKILHFGGIFFTQALVKGAQKP